MSIEFYKEEIEKMAGIVYNDQDGTVSYEFDGKNPELDKKFTNITNTYENNEKRYSRGKKISKAVAGTGAILGGAGAANGLSKVLKNSNLKGSLEYIKNNPKAFRNSGIGMAAATAAALAGILGARKANKKQGENFNQYMGDFHKLVSEENKKNWSK